MPGGLYDRILRMERIAAEVERVRDASRRAIVFIEQQRRQAWVEGSDDEEAPIGPCGASIPVGVSGCNSLALGGASVTADFAGTTYGPVTTNGTGNATLTGLPGGTCTLTVTHPLFVGSVTSTVVSTCGTSTGTQLIDMSVLTPTTGYQCTLMRCGRPFSTTYFHCHLAAPSRFISVPLTWDGTSQWSGSVVDGAFTWDVLGTTADGGVTWNLNRSAHGSGGVGSVNYVFVFVSDGINPILTCYPTFGGTGSDASGFPYTWDENP